MTAITAARIDLISMLLIGAIFDGDSRKMGGAIPTAFPRVEERACQHDRCHDDGNDLF